MKISILDDPVAIGLGLHVQRMKLIQLISSTILVSMAIQFSRKYWVCRFNCTTHRENNRSRKLC